MSNEINQFDVAFIVDVTGSMGSFLNAAQTLMVNASQSLAKNADANLMIGVVAYRDHPPQDTVVLSINQLTTPDEAQKRIQKLQVAGGGDAPEAVLDGVVAAAKKINWRKHSRRVAVLIGDAPPHGVGYPGDGFPKGCPCGDTIESASCAVEEAGVTLYAITISNDPTTKQAFGQLAQLTGGESFDSAHGSSALDRIQKILTDEFSGLAMDRKVLDAWDGDATVDTVAEKLGEKPAAIAASYARLSRRGLIRSELVPA